MDVEDSEEVGRSNVPANSTDACDDVLDNDNDVPLNNTDASSCCQDQTRQAAPTHANVHEEVTEYPGSDAGLSHSNVAKTNEGSIKADVTSETVLLTCNIPQPSESTQAGSCDQLSTQSQSAQLQTESASTKKHGDTKETNLHLDSDAESGASEDDSVFYMPRSLLTEQHQSELMSGLADAYIFSLSTRTPTHGSSLHSSVSGAERVGVPSTSAGGNAPSRNAAGDDEGDETAQIDALIVRIFQQLESTRHDLFDVPANRAMQVDDSDDEPAGSAENERRRQHAGLERWLREKGLRTAECAICCDECICVRQACCGLPVCIFCLRRYFHTRIDNGALQIACPNSECRQFVDRSEVTYFVNSAHKQRFYALLADANQFPNTRTCPACSCLYTLTAEQAALLHAANGSGEHGAVLVDGAPRPSGSAAKAQRRAAVREVRRNGLRVDCAACGAVWCFACHAAYHFATTCSEFRRGDKLVSHWARQRNAQTGRNAQRCPRCHVLIEKTSGCNHMTCQRCSAEFCYLCGRRYQRVKLLGGHDSRFSVFGCKYSLLPGNAPARNAIRGSLFVGKIMMCTLLGTLGAGLVVALLPVGVVAAPAVGIYVAVRNERKKRNARRVEREVYQWRERSNTLPLTGFRSVTEPTALSDSGSGSAPERESELPALFLFDDLNSSSFTLSSVMPRINAMVGVANLNDEAARPAVATTQHRSVDIDLSLRTDHDRQRSESHNMALPAQASVSLAREHERIDEDVTMRYRTPVPIEVDVALERSAPGWFLPRPPTPPPVGRVEDELPAHAARPPRAMSVARGIVHRVRSALRL